MLTGFSALSDALACWRISRELAVPFYDLLDHVIDFIGEQFGVHWQADAASGVGFSVCERANNTRIFAPRVTGLFVDGDRVMSFRVNSGFNQVIEQHIAPFGFLGFNDVEMIDVAIPGQFDRQIDCPTIFETGGVSCCPLTTMVVPFVYVFELGAEDSGMEVVKPAVETEAVNVSFLRAMVAQFADSGVDVWIVGDDCAAVAESTEILLDNEACGCGIAAVADAEAGAMGADGLCVVLDYMELVFGGDLPDCVHVGALAVEVNRHDGFCFWGDGGLDVGRADALGFRATIHEHSRCACDPDRFCRGEERIRVGDDLVAGPYSESHERQPDRVGAVADADCVLGSVVTCQLSLESFKHRAHDVLAAHEHLMNVGINFRLYVLVLSYVSVERNLHGEETKECGWSVTRNFLNGTSGGLLRGFLVTRRPAMFPAPAMRNTGHASKAIE